MAKVAYAMYGRRRGFSVGKDLGTAQLTEVSEFSTRRVRCCVGYWRSGRRASVVVGFRGSASIAEWANNAHPAEWKSVSPIIAGRVHPGFVHSLAEIWTGVAAAIQDLCQAHLPELLSSYASDSSVPICLVGHSRGGALAVLAGLRTLTTFLLPVHVYTFGAPRVGDSDFAHAYNEVLHQGESAHWRFECQGDPVPVFPFVFQAMHTGCLTYLTPDSPIVEIRGVERSPERRAILSVSRAPSRYHRMAMYLHLLNQMVAIPSPSVFGTAARVWAR